MRTNLRTSRLLIAVAAGCGFLGMSALPAGAQSLSVDLSGGTSFNRAILGQGLNNQAFQTEGREAGYEMNLGLTEGTSMRGPSDGSNAMTYNWETRVDKNQNVPFSPDAFAKGKSTLDMLRSARDNNSLPIFTVNTFGVGGFDGVTNQFVYTDTSITTLVQQAKDWVRYTNYILQNYRQGQESQMSADDQRILNEIYWQGPDYTSDKLLAPGEAPVPKVNYWEIGNEVDLPGNSASAADYRSRYNQITSAMLGQDPTIKVGPGMSGAQGGQPSYLETVLKNGFDLSTFTNYSKLPVNFIAYHPYGYQILGVDAATDHAGVSQQLNDIRANQQAERTWINQRITNSNGIGGNRSPSDFQYLATEWNPAYPSPPSGQDANWKLRQWNALGIVETAMTYAQMGFSAANFWVWPADINSGAELPQYKAFKALNAYGGDTLVESYTAQDNFRVYVTKDSKTGTIAIWGMNFLFGDPGDAAKTIHLSLSNLGIDPGKITLMRLADLTGPTTLLSGNNFYTNGVTVDWIKTDMTGMDLSSFDFTVNPAELSLLVIQVPEPSAALGGMIGLVLLISSRPFVRRKACASRQSVLLFNGGLS